MVHYGTDLRKGDYFVEFKEFFSIMKKRISDRTILIVFLEFN